MPRPPKAPTEPPFPILDAGDAWAAEHPARPEDIAEAAARARRLGLPIEPDPDA